MRCSSCRISPNFSVYLWHERKRAYQGYHLVRRPSVSSLLRFFSLSSDSLLDVCLCCTPKRSDFSLLLFVLSCDYVCMSKETTLSGFVILFLAFSFFDTHREILIEFEHFFLFLSFSFQLKCEAKKPRSIGVAVVARWRAPTSSFLASFPTFTLVTRSSSSSSSL